MRAADHTSCARWNLAVHGAAVELVCAVEELEDALRWLTHPFDRADWHSTYGPARGEILPYDADVILPRLSASATRIQAADALTEIYRDGDRYWLVDERWGMAEMNLLTGRWQSWILPRPRIDAVRCLEAAVLWPMAQVIRSRGVHLVPGISVVKDGFAALLIGPVGLEPELSALARAGYRIIGQQWTALREEEDRVAMLHVPGVVERPSGPRLQSRLSPGAGWVDLREEYPRAWQQHAFCDAVLVAEPARRPHAHLRSVADHVSAASLLRRNWPITELYPGPRRLGSEIVTRLARQCHCAQVQVSRNPKDMIALLQSLRDNFPVMPGAMVAEREDGSGADVDLTLTPWSDIRPQIAA